MFTQNSGHPRFIFGTIFIAAVITQIRANKFNAYLYWITIIATTSLGTTLANFADRSLGIGYLGGTLLLSTLFISSLFVWHQTMGSILVEAINSHKAEMFIG